MPARWCWLPQTDRSCRSGLLKGLIEEVIQPRLGGFAHGFYRNLLNQFVDERHGQQYVGLPATDASGNQVEHGSFIQLADGSTVGALDVIRVDFQFRLGVDFGTVGQQQVLVVHIRVGLLGVLVDMNPAIKHRVGLVRSNVAVGLFAVAVGGYVVNGGVVVVVLFTLGNPTPLSLVSAPSPSRRTCRSCRRSGPPKPTQWLSKRELRCCSTPVAPMCCTVSPSMVRRMLVMLAPSASWNSVTVSTRAAESPSET